MIIELHKYFILLLLLCLSVLILWGAIKQCLEHWALNRVYKGSNRLAGILEIGQFR